jgi:hypothetical protein
MAKAMNAALREHEPDPFSFNEASEQNFRAIREQAGQGAG